MPYFKVSRQNRVVFNCFATKHVKDVRSGQPLFCNQPPRGPESEPEIARVSQSEPEKARVSQSEPERARGNQRESERARESLREPEGARERVRVSQRELE